jgi:sphingomyelin phosphodiesterase acid-like 3
MPTVRQIAAAALLLITATLHAQTRPRTTPAPAGTVPAIFLSDIHLDPYSDPAKVPQLIAAPASDWGTILASPDSATRAKDFAELARSCPDKGADTDDRLWQSSLIALHANSHGALFATVTGDLLAHSFDCKYKKLAPKPTAQEYVAFTAKTVQYIVSGLQNALPGIPIYFALGNNDSGCADYHLEGSGDPFLAAIAPMLAETLPATARQSASADLAAGGHYTALLPAPFAPTRVISVDDLYFSSKYANCAAQPDPAPAQAQLDWLNAQLSAARANHERVWFIGHIPPGVNLYASARKLIGACSASSVQSFLATDSLASALAANSDIVPLALFGHTHSDEIRLLSPDDLVPAGSASIHAQTAGVPVKVIPSITPINGNLPAFIIGKVRPATSTLIDYTVIMASDRTGVGTKWEPNYAYSARYHKRDFDSASVSSLIHELHADRALATPESQGYVSSYTEGVPSPILQLAWGPYTCALSHTTSKSFAACACGQ